MRSVPQASGRRVLLVAVLLLCTSLAGGAGPASPGALAATTGGALLTPIRDPAPPPGSVVEAGSHQVAASVTGIASGRLRFSIDGQPVTAPTADVDGGLGNRRGVEVELQEGVRTIGVHAEGRGLLRSWQVHVVGLEVDRAGDDATLVAVRLAGSRAGSRPVVLTDPAVDGLGALGVALAAQVGGVLLPAPGGTALPASTLAAVADLRAQRAILVGGPQVVDPVVAAQLVEAGLQVTRIEGGSAAEVSLAALEWLAGLPLDARPAVGEGIVVAPAAPRTTALSAAARAAELAAPLVLVADGEVDDDLGSALSATAASAGFVLLSDQLPPTARSAIEAVLPQELPRNIDPLQPPQASELVVVSDDASPGAAAVAAQAIAGGRAVVYGQRSGADHVAATRPGRVLLVGPDTTTSEMADQLRRAWASTSAAPEVQSVIDGTTSRPSITFIADQPLRDAHVHVELLGLEWAGQTIVAGDRAVWTATPRPRLPEPLEPQRPDTPATITITASVESAAGATRHLSARGTVDIAPVASLSREGFVVAGGSSDVVGTGPLRTFSVAIEPATGLSLGAVTEEVERILLDPRGWTADGSVSLQRIGTSRSARIDVVVATPRTVDALCGAVGLRTGGRVSCWDGYRAMLNLTRWNEGVIPFHADIERYRQYLVNHEVGHGLGHGHEYCPRAGVLAPVMVQQTGGLGGCLPNGWPFPDAEDPGGPSAGGLGDPGLLLVNATE